MSWARAKVVETKLCCRQWSMDTEEAVTHAIRETIEEAARRASAACTCDDVDGCAATAAVNLMLTDETQCGGGR